jgi:hypothetical protein
MTVIVAVAINRAHTESGGFGGFLPAVKQIANVAALPGIVHVRQNDGALHSSSRDVCTGQSHLRIFT